MWQRKDLAAKGTKGTKGNEIGSLLQHERICPMNDLQIKTLTNQIRETAFALHRYLRHGHLEKVYENGLAHRLRKQGLTVEQQYPIQVLDEDGTVLGDFRADLFVENSILIELKACKTLDNEHIAQLLGYLRGTRVEHGLLVNFGAPKLQIHKYILTD
jgi:GxxExxY protein